MEMDFVRGPGITILRFGLKDTERRVAVSNAMRTVFICSSVPSPPPTNKISPPIHPPPHCYRREGFDYVFCSSRRKPSVFESVNAIVKKICYEHALLCDQ